MSAHRNTPPMSNWNRVSQHCAAIAMIIRITENLDVGANVSPNSESNCKSPRAHSLALHFTNSPDGPVFSLYWNMEGSSTVPGGRSTIMNVPLSKHVFILTSSALSHLSQSEHHTVRPPVSQAREISKTSDF
eukprot:1852613-Rhodomonas_salina.1